MKTPLPWPPPIPDDGPRADIGVFGGSGFYEFLPKTAEYEITTPFGPPSAPIVIGHIGGRRVAFVARHGKTHSHSAHAVNYRANVWAMQQAGVRAIVAPCAVGSLQPELRPGDMVITDQLVDRTWGRSDTFFDGDHSGPTAGAVNHLTFADPYDATLRAKAVAAARTEGISVHDGGTVVVINGPRFSTRAESRWFAQMGWSVVNMTQYPEAVLCAEMQLPYVGISLVTDYDAGVEQGEGDQAPVTMEQVFAVLKANIERVRRVLFRLIPDIV